MPKTGTLGGGLRFGILPCSPPHFLRTAHWGCRIARQTGASVGGAKSDLKLTSLTRDFLEVSKERAYDMWGFHFLFPPPYLA